MSDEPSGPPAVPAAPLPPPPGACPVCRARFRSTRECTRCGADLAPLHRTLAQAYLLRRHACHHLTSGDIPTAARLLLAADQLHRPPSATTEPTHLLAEWLERHTGHL